MVHLKQNGDEEQSSTSCTLSRPSCGYIWIHTPCGFPQVFLLYVFRRPLPSPIWIPFLVEGDSALPWLSPEGAS